MNTKKILVSFFFIVNLTAYSVSLSQAWVEARTILNSLESTFKNEASRFESKYLTPGWRDCQKQISDLIRGPERNDFLRSGIISMAMFREENGPVQSFESNYLQQYTKKETQTSIAIAQFKEIMLGGVRPNIPHFNCGSNTLAQMFALVKLFDSIDDGSISTIMEWGGGYGCMARVCKQLRPNVRYVIVDLIPLLSLQYLYLRACLSVPIHVHTVTSLDLSADGIHLVPVYLLDSIPQIFDGFISTFALTECPHEIQQKVISNNFFGAKNIYVSGLLHDLYDEENKRVASFHASTIAEYLEDKYIVTVQPHHITSAPHFELIARK